MSDAVIKGSWFFPTYAIILFADVLTAKVYVSNLSKCWVHLKAPSEVSASGLGTREPVGTVPYTVGLGDMGRIFAAVSVCGSLTVVSAHK